MAVLYINPFAENKAHTVEFKDPSGRVYKARVSTSTPHLSLIALK
jgi:hypothetical protein